MIKPLEEIRVAQDAVELIITLRSKHTAFPWALEACEWSGDFWRVLIVVHEELGIIRTALTIDAKSTPTQIAGKVSDYLSKLEG
jgi:hypothetical protein